MPDGCTQFNNCFSFGLASFTGLQGHDAVTGVRKSMKSGNDCFGSIMLLVEVMPGEGTVLVEKKLMYDGNGASPTLPQAGVGRTLTFHVVPVDNAPMPRNAANEIVDTFTINFPPNTVDGASVEIEMGVFKFDGNVCEGNGPTWNFVYDVEEVRTGNIAPWTYDTRKLQLHFEIIDEDGQFKVKRYWWTVKNAPNDPDNFFKNDYTLPVRLDVKKVNMATPAAAINGAKFMLYKDANCTEIADVFTNEARTTPLTVAGVTTGSNGIASFYGIDKDDSPYYLKEISVPSPYILDDTKVTITYNTTSKVWESASPDPS